ncbi:DNA-methyltransferase [Pseudomonas chlororaphis]|uniref:DNA-methyltransferase n=1 Tax=Pseudomonas chlororaphis TaxID=587753 RepID=UPI002407D300|nr:site-specific DNA-methyltransferase [Pseudomonas chlororaphis]
MFNIFRGDCLEALRRLPANSVDSIVTDPPYGISFQGRRWDCDVPPVEVWAECYRVLKPGGHLLAFAGSRTQHRMTTRIEDAGFEIRDMMAWVYGSGFPKSRDVSAAMEGYQAGDRSIEPDGVRPGVYEVTAFLRAARERAGWSNRQIDELFGTNGMAGHWTTSGSQPAVPTVAQWAKLKAALAFGDDLDDLVESLAAKERPAGAGGDGAERFLSSLGRSRKTCQPAGDWGTALKPALEPITVARKPPRGSVTANVQVLGTGALNIGGCRIGEEQRWPANLIHDGGAEVDDSLGAASRFFYCPKATRVDREDGNDHPTVKPTDLMRYLCRLVTPPGGLVLDPYMGSGSTGKAALLEGFRFQGCEISDSYADIAQSRLERVERPEAAVA